MKATSFKRIGKKIGAKLLMAVLSCAMLVSSVSAFAMPKIAKEEKMGYGDDGMGHYYSAFSSNEELKEATKEKNIEIASEGTILLKNGGGVDGTEDKLPYTDMKNISIFGINSDAFGYGNEANWRTHCEVLVGAGYNGDVNAVTWYAISSGLTFGSGEWWEWLTHRMAVPSAMLGQRDVVVAFRYRISGADDAPAWEIKNFSFTAKCAGGGEIIPVSSIMLPSSVPPLAIGESCTLTPTIFPENATDKRVMWTSGDVTVAVVDANGTVTGISEGETVITATTVDGGYTAECRITVVGGTDVEMTAADAVTVYPNPVRDVLNVETGGAAVVRMEMTDAAGHAVMSIEGDEHTVDVSALPEGLYLLRIETERGVTVRKIVKRM